MARPLDWRLREGTSSSNSNRTQFSDPLLVFSAEGIAPPARHTNDSRDHRAGACTSITDANGTLRPSTTSCGPSAVMWIPVTMPEKARRRFAARSGIDGEMRGGHDGLGRGHLVAHLRRCLRGARRLDDGLFDDGLSGGHDGLGRRARRGGRLRLDDDGTRGRDRL